MSNIIIICDKIHLSRNGAQKYHEKVMTPILIDVAMASEHWIPNVDYAMVNQNLAILRDLMLDYGIKKGIKIVDTQELFSQLYTEENKTDYLRDGLHPTVLGHEAMAKFLQD